MAEAAGQGTPGGAGGRLDLTRIAIVVIGAAALLVAALAAMRAGSGIEASVGNLKFTVQKDDSFSDILNKAMAKDGDAVAALLAGKGFYRVDDPRILGEVAKLDPGDPDDAKVVAGLRQMLWNLEGPFHPPHTMQFADARLVGAIEEQAAPADDPNQGRLVAELLKRSLDRSGIFELRHFPARLVALPPLSGALANTAAMIVTCPGSEIIGKQAQIWGAGQTVFAEVQPDVRLAGQCDGTAKTIQELLQGKPGVLGVSPEAYKVLTAPPPPGAQPAPSFNLNPVDLAPPLFAKG
ncbi:MAG: hypothetical protein U1E40_06050 [Amaricoccus sp.]